MRQRITWLGASLGMLASFAGVVQAAELPRGIMRQVPSGYEELTTARATFAGPSRTYYIVALKKKGELEGILEPQPASARLLLLFARQPDGSFLQIGRNDGVILRADQGGQCDPFLDGGGVIAVHGRYFTVKNGVACGQHWTDTITFRFDDPAGRFVFDNERLQSWSMNPSTDPNAEAVVSNGVHMRRGDRGRPVTFENWRPSR